MYTAPDGLDAHRCQYVEFLFNPIEKMVAVRPCTKDHPNAIRWADDNGRSVGVGATALCKTIFALQNWDTDYSFRVPVSVMQEDEHTILLFDLDNYIGKEIGKKPPAVLEPQDGAPAELSDEEPEDTAGFFYSAKDEAQAIEDTEEMKRRMELIAEYEEKRFGTPFAEFDDDVRLPECDGNWDIMAEARPLDIDHSVNEGVITSLQDELLEEKIAAEEAAAVKSAETAEAASVEATVEATEKATGEADESNTAEEEEVFT